MPITNVAAVFLLVFFQARSGAFPVSADLDILPKGSRRLLQDPGLKIIIPVYQDQSPCATFNAEDASPVVNKENAPLGWATIQQGSLNSSGLATLQIDLTAHIGGLYLADSSSSQPDGSNVRACILTDIPDGCPATSVFMYHMGQVADCNKRRATVEVPIPIHMFNCSHLTPTNFTTTFYVQLEADLATNQCSAPEGTYYAGSVSKAISRGCTYITVQATCTPNTCDPPPPREDTLAAAPTASQATRLLPLVVGVSVGSGVLILALLAGFAYLRKRLRDAALRHKYSENSDFSDFYDEPATTDDDSSSYELDFSGHSTTILAGGAGHSPSAAGHGSVFLGGASTLFSRSPRSAAAAKAAASVSMLPEAASGSAAMFTGSWAALPPGPAASQAAVMSSVRPSEVLRQAGAARFSDKYGNRTAASAVVGIGGGAGSEGASVRGGAASGMGHGIAYNNAAYSISSGAGAGAGARASESGAYAGRPSAEITVSSSQVELLDDAGNANYRLSRLSSKIGPGFGVGVGASGANLSMGSSALATPLGQRGRSSVVHRPAPAATPTPGRSSVADVGFGSSPSYFAGGASITLGSGGGRGGGGGAAAGAAVGAGLYDPQAVPENDIAFINPLAMLGDSSEGESSAAEGGYAPRAAALQRLGGGVAAAAAASGVGGLPQRSASAVPAARAPPAAWPGSGRGGRGAAAVASLQQRQQVLRNQQPFGYLPQSEDDEESLLTSPRRQRSIAVPSRPAFAAMPAAPAAPSPSGVAASAQPTRQTGARTLAATQDEASFKQYFASGAASAQAAAQGGAAAAAAAAAPVAADPAAELRPVNVDAATLVIPTLSSPASQPVTTPSASKPSSTGAPWSDAAS